MSHGNYNVFILKISHMFNRDRLVRNRRIVFIPLAYVNDKTYNNDVSYKYIYLD